MDPSNSATYTAEEHFRRQAYYEEMENKKVINGAVNNTLSIFWVVMILILKSTYS